MDPGTSHLEQLEVAERQLLVFAREINHLYQAERARAAELERALGRLRGSYLDMIKTLPVNSAGRGALVARIGDAVPFAVGEQWEGKAPISGRLFLGVNQASGDTGAGSFSVKLTRVGHCRQDKSERHGGDGPVRTYQAIVRDAADE